MSRGRAGGAALGAADILSLAASPVFAIMALLTAVHGPRAADLICAATDVALPLNGMTLMYLLMSAFHCAPWLRLAAARPCPVLPSCVLPEMPGEARLES